MYFIYVNGEQGLMRCTSIAETEAYVAEVLDDRNITIEAITIIGGDIINFSVIKPTKAVVKLY